MDLEATQELVQELTSAVLSWRMQECRSTLYMCTIVSRHWRKRRVILHSAVLFYELLPICLDYDSSLSEMGSGAYPLCDFTLCYCDADQHQLGRDISNLLPHQSRDLQGLVYHKRQWALPLILSRAFLIAHPASYAIAVLTADVALGLCLSALLGAKPVFLAVILFLCAAHPFMTWIFNIVGNVQIPAQDLDILDEELGYPCHPVSSEDFFGTVAGMGADIRAYVNCARTALLVILAVAVFVLRYRKTSGRIMQVLRRDGGLCYLIATATRFAAAFIYTPAILSSGNFESNPISIVIMGAQEVMVPILAQRLLINMRNVDYMGSRPFASTLMFAKTPENSEDLFDDGNNFELKE